MIIPAGQLLAIIEKCKDIARNAFPIESQHRTLSATNIQVVSDPKADVPSYQKQKKMTGGTIAHTLYADLMLKDTKTGKVIDEQKRYPLLKIPHITDKGTVIVDGKDTQMVNQIRLRPGIYGNVEAGNVVDVFINTAGRGFHISFDRDKGRMLLTVGGKNSGARFPMYSVLTQLGIPESRLVRAWGQELVDINKKLDDPNALADLYKKLLPYGAKPENDIDLRKGVESYLESKSLDIKSTSITMGRPVEKLSGDILFDSTVKALDIAQDKKEPDDSASIAVKAVYSADDFIPEQAQKGFDSAKYKIRMMMDKNDNIVRFVSTDMLTKPIMHFFKESELTRYSDQNNVLDMISSANLATIMGPGGIGSTHAVRDEVRSVHPSLMGIIDPSHTPEGDKIGITTRLSIGAVKEGNDLATEVMDVKTGKTKLMTADKIEQSVISFADQWDMKSKIPKPKNKNVRAKDHGHIMDVPATKVEYIYPDERMFFGISASTIPFLNSNNSNRVLMGARHLDQAVSLVDRDAPLVQADWGGKGFEQAIGKTLTTESEVTGTVYAINEDSIVVKDQAGKKHTYNIHKNYPLNSYSYLDETPIVAVGDKVITGQQLTDNNFSKDGSLALGKNLTVAYIPWKGYNFEDATVISEAAAKKLTSIHKHEYDLSLLGEVLIGPRVLLANYPDVRVRAEILDDTGVVKKGVTVLPHDILVPAVKKSTVTSDYARLHPKLARPFLDVSVVYDGSVPGEVTDVFRTREEIRILVKTREAAQIGDKVSQRAGAKGIIVDIIPDEGMPYIKGTNKKIDVLLNPTGVPGRVNPGQIFEAAMGKVADKTGETYLAPNFKSDEPVVKTVRKALKKNDIPETDTVIDPTNGVEVEGVHTGIINMIKLRHQVEKKFSARGLGPYTSEGSPTQGEGQGGQSIGPMEFYALLAGDARKFLGDVATVKAGKNDDYWRAVMMGLPPSTPNVPFVNEKFSTYLQGAGANIKQSGRYLQLLPLTDKEILARSAGAVQNARVVNDKSITPEKGGLFDEQIVGGPSGTNWNHYKLSDPIINPLLTDAIVAVSGFTKAQLAKIMEGTLYVTPEGKVTTDERAGITGGAAVEKQLSKVDPRKELTATIEKLDTAKRSSLDTLNKKRRALQGLVDLNMKPTDAYIMHNMPIIPARFRSYYPAEDGTIRIADPNHGYKEVILVNEQLDKLKSMGVDDKNLAPVRRDAFKAFEGMVGLTEPLTKSDEFSGFTSLIKGPSAKEGLYQARMIKRRQDLSGRSTAIVDPKLNINEIGIPGDMAKKIYEPFIMRRLVQKDIKPIDAKRMIEEGHPAAYEAMKEEMDNRPVILNRAPSLHKYNLIGQYPMLVEGRAVRTNPLIIAGLNLDYDGNCTIGQSKIYLTIAENMVHSLTLQSELVCSVREAIMRATAGTRLNAQKEVPITINIEDFPKIGAPGKDRNGADVYEVPAGIKVLTVDIGTGTVSYQPVKLFTHETNAACTVVKTDTRQVEVSNNKSLAVFCPETGALVKEAPDEAIGCFVPIVRSVYSYGTYGDIDTGWLYGSLISDGWQSKGYVGYAKVEDRKRDAVIFVIRQLFGKDVQVKTYTDEPKEGKNKYGRSKKIHINDSRVVDGLLPLTYADPRTGERNALYKSIHPALLHTGSRECLIGLFCGLMEGDGSLSINRGKARSKPQYIANFATSSKQLADDFQELCWRIGIRCGLTTTPPRDTRRTAYTLTVSIPDMWNMRDEFMFIGEQHQEWFRDFTANGPYLDRLDVVPLMTSEIKLVRKAATAAKNKSLYTVAKKGFVSRQLLTTIAEQVPNVFPQSVLTRMNIPVLWERIQSSTPSGRKAVYDLYVPGPQVFAANNGLVIYDTVAIHTPVSEEARKEVIEKLMPSQNLFSSRDLSIMHSPSKEMIGGIYLMTKPDDSKKPVPVKDKDTARLMLETKKIRANTPLLINRQIWTAGQILINDLVPDNLKPGNIVVDKKVLGKLMESAAKENTAAASVMINKIKDYGFKYVTELGLPLTLADLDPDRRERDKIIDQVRKDSKTIGFDAAVEKGVKDIQNLVKTTGNNLSVWGPLSGALGSKSGEIAQMIFSPVAVVDHKGKPIPVVIPKSYAEGMPMSDYWATLPGARKGMVDKGLGPAKTGKFAKDIVSMSIDERVTEHDCKTTEGIEMALDDPDILDRFALDPYKNEPVTPQLTRALKDRGKKTMIVRSPLKCRARSGVCQLCAGLNEYGRPFPIGFHLGALAATTISEPLTQMVLRSFHSGGRAGTKSVGYNRVSQIYSLPQNLPGKSTIATLDGEVKNVEKTARGGWDVTIDNVDHFVPIELGLNVKKGDRVKAGDKLSKEGVYDMPELLEVTKDVNRVQKQMIGDLKSELAAGGIKMNSRWLETTIKPMTDRVVVTQQGDGPDYYVYRGEIYPAAFIEELNNKLKKEHKHLVEYEPTILPISKAPMTRGDMFSQMMVDVVDPIKKNVTEGGVIDLHEGSALTRYISGRIGDEKPKEENRWKNPFKMVGDVVKSWF